MKRISKTTCVHLVIEMSEKERHDTHCMLNNIANGNLRITVATAGGPEINCDMNKEIADEWRQRTIALAEIFK